MMLVNVLFRLVYGIGALLSLAQMATAQLVPDTEAQPQARLFVSTARPEPGSSR